MIRREGGGDVRERRDDQTLVDAQSGNRLPQVPEPVEGRTRIEALGPSRRVDPFVDGNLEVVLRAEVLDQCRVDRDLVAQHDLEVLDPGSARHERDVAHDHRRVELVLGVLLRPRGEADRQMSSADSAFVVQLLCLRSDGLRTTTGVGEDVVIADEARQAGGAAGQQLCQSGRVSSGEVDAAVTRVPEMKHSVATAQMGGLLLPLGEDISEFWELFVYNGIRHNSTLTRNCSQ